MVTLGSLGGADRPLSVSDSSPRRRRASLVDEIDRNGAAVKRNVRRETRLYQIAMRQVVSTGWMVCGKVCELVCVQPDGWGEDLGKLSRV